MGAGPAPACPPRDSASGSIQEGAMQSKSDSQAQQISSTPDDDQLIRRGLRGDPDALETLFARHNRALYQTALRVLGNPKTPRTHSKRACSPPTATCDGSRGVRSFPP